MTITMLSMSYILSAMPVVEMNFKIQRNNSEFEDRSEMFVIGNYSSLEKLSDRLLEVT